jgi:hypothetical protein
MSAVVDIGEITLFVETMFRHAEPGGFVSMRAFRDDVEEPWNYAAWTTPQIAEGLDDVINAAIKLATMAAAASVPVVFCPPVATFKTANGAAEKDIKNGVELVVECDAHPKAAREKLENLLGPATMVVASGGVWIDPATGAKQAKVHLRWLLTKPTREFAEHVKLKEARRMAMRYVGADASAVPLAHPLRWPGSIHKKAEPRLACIVDFRNDIEIDLDDAYERLQEAVKEAGAAGAAGGARQREGGASSDRPDPADILDINAALAVIPNDDLEWDDWNRIMMATWAASDGSEAGFAAAAAWSSKAKKFDFARTRERWEHITKSPPDRIGFGSLMFYAREAWPGFERPSARTVGGAAAGPHAGKVRLEDFYAYMESHKYIFVPTRALWPAASVNGCIPRAP